MRLICLIISLNGLAVFGQTDTLNQIDSTGQKQGYWIVYGYMKPEKHYADSLKIEEGRYLNDRKEGHWFFYRPDGKTPKLEGDFTNGRPNGPYVKGWGLQYHDSTGCGITHFHCDTSVLYSSDSLKRYDSKKQQIFSSEPFKSNGRNIVYDMSLNLIMEGQFEFNALWNGRYYIYNSDGDLEKIEIWEDGKYCCNAGE